MDFNDSPNSVVDTAAVKKLCSPSGNNESESIKGSSPHNLLQSLCLSSINSEHHKLDNNHVLLPVTYTINISEGDECICGCGCDSCCGCGHGL